MTATALIIDDEPDIRELIAMTLSRMGLDYHTAANLDEARNLLQKYEFAVCLTDMRLPDGNGVDFVRYIQSTQPDLPVAVITAHGNMDAAVEAMKNGAYDFVSKPVDIQQLRKLVVQAVSLNAGNARGDAANDRSVGEASAISTPTSDKKTVAIPINDESSPATTRAANATDVGGTHQNSPAATSKLQTNTAKHRQPVTSKGKPLRSAADLAIRTEKRLIGQSQPIHDLRTMIAKVARTNAPVWITGESGTGKELIARLIHQSGPRADQNFVAINCGAIPSELMESELFGHMKGSFTGATSDKQGLFQRANGGTLFLDEVAELPLHMQVKLLRAVQERSVRPVGGSEEIVIDARILSASHKDLAIEVEQARFRHDLYYRLNVITLRSPSLRERPEDIPALCEHILTKLANDSHHEHLFTLASNATDALRQYSFPGNVRELENLLERAVAMADSDIIGDQDLDLPSIATTQSEVATDANDKKTSEREHLIKALDSTRWNRKAAAEKLGLTYRQLRYRIQQLGINDDDAAGPSE